MISTQRIEEFKRLHRNNEDLDAIAKDAGVLQETVKRYLRAANLDTAAPIKQPKILLLDIETLPLTALAWRTGYNITIGIDNIIQDMSMVCWAAKWLNEPEIFSAVLTGQQARDRNDKEILQGIWDLVEEANIVIGHNARKFDMPILNSRWKLHGFGPPSPYKILDTYTESRKLFRFSSLKLDFLANILTGTGKTHTDYSLWVKCHEGDQDSLIEMLGYNENDVRILEDVYMDIRPWIYSHPNYGLYLSGEGEVCANCGSSKLNWDVTPYFTPAGRFKAYRCECGAIGRSRYSDLSKEERKSLVVGTAR